MLWVCVHYCQIEDLLVPRLGVEGWGTSVWFALTSSMLWDELAL